MLLPCTLPSRLIRYSRLFSRSPPSCTRSIRTKARIFNVNNDLRREELWLAKLQKDLATKRESLRQEDTQEEKAMNRQLLEEQDRQHLQDHPDTFFWRHVLTVQERRQLERYGIKSLDAFQGAYLIARRVEDETTGREHVNIKDSVLDKHFFVIETFDDARDRLLKMNTSMEDDDEGNMEKFYLEQQTRSKFQ